ncbi:MAG TPA: hypothetical protein VFC00_17910 [Micromonosporaceae bacterium]|nr:hypothetical protein [Micromonosporaceae bacterium]
MRRRETREHVTHYLEAFNAWATGTPLTQLRYVPTNPSRPSPSDGNQPVLGGA